MIEKILVCSTSNIKESTSNWLKEQVVTSENMIVYEKEEYGFFIPVIPSCVSEEIPEDIEKIVRFAIEKECDWIMIDRDAEGIEGLPTYHW